MNNKYTNVMSPIRIGNHLIKNRIISAPVTLHSASNGETYPTETAMNFFTQRAKEGAGIVVCAGAKVIPVVDDGEHAGWDLYKHNSMHKLAELAERIHFYGAKASMELIGIFEDGYVASEGGLLMDGVTPGREIPKSEMERYKEGFAHSAEALMNLGYDGLLLHFGHSIPLAQFLSPLTNHRKDEYGGSFENRLRYFIEILEEIRNRVKDRMFIEIRMSADEYREGGIDTEEGIKIAEVFQKYADIIQASCGMITPDLMCRTHPCDFLPPNPNIHLAETLKKSSKITETYITAIGAIGNLQDADEIIASGKADFVAISRALIADPQLITKSMLGKEEDVVPCIKCMRCHDSTVYGHFLQCSVNPTIGLMEHLEKMISIPRNIQNIAVIGGGPAGMYAALTAAKRGHTVTLYEKSIDLGGMLKFASKVDFKYSLAKFKDYLINEILYSTVNVVLNTNVEPEDIENVYDAVIVAIGAEPIVPSIKGIGHTIIATEVYGNETKLKKDIIVIGGGQVGCETALHLAKIGKTITVVEMKGELAPDASPTHRGELISEINNEKNFSYIVNGKCTEIKPNGIIYEKDGVNYTMSADHIILAAGMQSKKYEADGFISTAPIYWVAGDCVEARTAEMAVREGYFAGINI